MNEEEVLKKIDERLNEKLEERLKPIEEGLKSLLSKDSDVETEKAEKTETEKDIENKENETLKKENLTLQETLDILRAEKAKLEEELKKGVSKTTKGQEDDSDTVYEFSYRQHMEELGRDSQGRAKLRKEMK